MKNMMKAVIYNKQASPDKFVYCDVEIPTPTDNEVLIKVKSASVNAADYRSMKMGMIPKKKIFGADLAGIVEAVGKNIKKFKPGDEVIGELSNVGFGGFAQYAVALETVLIHKPANISFEEAAALPMASVTALQGLRDIGHIQRGQHVLIVGSSGGVGTFAVQLGQYFGAIVTGVCSTKHVEQTKILGADSVIDYKRENFAKTNRTYDLILAINGNYPLSLYKRMLNPNGRSVMVGGTLSQIFKSMLFARLMSFGSKKMRMLMAKSNQQDLAYIASLVERGDVTPVIDKQFPLDRTADAMRYIAEGHAKGKILIHVE